jgi:hypothetical protein
MAMEKNNGDRGIDGWIKLKENNGEQRWRV